MSYRLNLMKRAWKRAAWISMLATLPAIFSWAHLLKDRAGDAAVGGNSDRTLRFSDSAGNVCSCSLLNSPRLRRPAHWLKLFTGVFHRQRRTSGLCFSRPQKPANKRPNQYADPLKSFSGFFHLTRTITHPHWAGRNFRPR
jgi:hypothetical protein